MRWPFRTKHSPTAGSSSADSDGPVYAESVPRAEWNTLPPAPIAISVRAPRTIVGTTSAIRRPIGLRELVDVTDDAAVGVVDGLVGVKPVAFRASTRPEVPVGEASALPDVVGRPLRAVDGNGRAVLTTSESVIVARPAADVPAPASAPARDRAPGTDGTEGGEGADMPHAPRSSLAQSRRMGLGPGYHGTLPDAIRRDRLDRAMPADDDGELDVERVPDDLRTVIRDAYGHDVGDQVVHRGPDVSEEARQLGAHAFARDGEVFVPMEAGPLDRAPAKSLLAHELTHLVQQRRRSAPLPPDGSPEAHALEAEAQRAERFVRGDPGAPAPGPMTARPANDGPATELADTQRFVNELVHRGVAEPDGTGGIRFLWGHGGGGRVQRAAEPAGAAAREENWNVAASVAHAVGESIAGEFEDMVVGEFSFVTGLEDEITAAHDAREREFRRQQTKEAFGRLRLEHLRVAKRNEAGGAELTEAQELELRRAVDAEVQRRTDALEFRVKTHLDQVNEQLRHADQPTQRELDPDRYDAIFDKLFAQPEGDLPDDDAPADVKAHAERAVTKAKAAAATRGAPHGVASGPPTPAGGMPSSPAGSGGGGGRAPGGTTGGGAGGIDSWDALRGALVTDLAVLEAGEFGVTLTQDELDSIRRPSGAAPAAPAQTADKAAQPGGASAPGTTAAPGAGRDAKHVGPSGHEKIDLDRLDFEELTKRLFPRLRSSLRQELLVDRERSGRLNHH
jgi:hypothetical protein